MESGMGAVKQDTIEAQSEMVKKVSRMLRDNIEDFLEGSKPEVVDKAIPTPKLDAIAQIADNLVCAGQALDTAGKLFELLKARIRN